VQDHRRKLARTDVGDARARERAPDALTGRRFLQVETAAEAASRAGDDDCAHVGIARGVLEGARQPFEHGERDGVQAIGTVEGQERHVPALLHEEVGHAARLARDPGPRQPV
jgi:hypothetical protein